MRAALLILPFIASPAAADLTVCNETETRTSVAIGYGKGDDWISEGWWRIEPSDCRVVIKGKLPKRYYYWRATTSSDTLVEGKFSFCTNSEPFTIVGDKDCAERGFKKARFQEVDIGEASDYKLAVSESSGKKAAPKEAKEPAQAPVQTDQGPGTFGEPITIVGEFQGCWAVSEDLECEFTADGWSYIASEAGPSPLGVIEALGVFSQGMRLQVSGDLISYAGSRAEIMIRDIEPAPAPAAPPEPRVSASGLIEHMQGYWDSDAGDGYAWIVEGNFLREIYDANIMRESYFEIAATCAASDGQGPVVIAWPEPDEGEGPSCYVVTETAQRHLAVRDVIEGRNISFSYSQ